MKGKVVKEFGVYSVEVNYCKTVGIKDRAQKANELMKKDKSYKQRVRSSNPCAPT